MYLTEGFEVKFHKEQVIEEKVPIYNKAPHSVGGRGSGPDGYS